MNILTDIMPWTWWAITFAGALTLIAYIMVISLSRRMKRFEKAHLALQTFMSGKNLDGLLQEYIKEIARLADKMEDCEDRLTKTEKKLRNSVDNAELLRYNAFDNMGSDLSFSLALLNQQGNGVVISSINSREESRVYAKPVSGGQSTYHLSKEEQEVIRQALTSDKI